MKKLSLMAGIILSLMLALGTVSCEKKQGAAGTGTSPGAQTGTESGAGAESQMGMAQGQIDINTATAQELQSVPGIDQTLAQNILSYRDQNGPFSSVDDLSRVQGMDQQKLDSVRNYLTVGQAGTSTGGAGGMGSSGTSGSEGMGTGGSSGTDGTSGSSGGAETGGADGTSGSGSSGY